MSRTNSRNRIRLKDWKFNEDEIVKLLWVGDPYKIDSEWKADIYFKSLKHKNIEIQTVDWGTVAITKVGELYKNGKEIKDKSDLSLTYMKSYHNYIDTFHIDGSKMELKRTNHKFGIIKSFVYKVDNIEIRIPVFEVLRSILARNKRLLYAILEPNSLHRYFTWHGIKDDFILKSKGEYPKSLLRDKRHVYYLSWILSDKHAYSSWNEVYKNLVLLDNGLEFTFPILNEFIISGRYFLDNNNVTKIEQIYDIYGSNIKYSSIEVLGVEKYNSRQTKTPKKHVVVKKPEEYLVDEDKGARKDTDLVKISMSNLDKPQDIKVKYQSTTDIDVNTLIDHTTNLIYKDNIKARSLGDFMTNNNEKSLEFIDELDNKTLDSDIGTLIKVFKELTERYGLNISYRIGYLPLTDKDKKFRYVDDRSRVRMFLFASIRIDSRIIYLLDIERAGKSLSTLILHRWDYKGVRDIDNIIKNAMEKLVDNNGSWDMRGVLLNGLVEKRIRHLKGRNRTILRDKYYIRLANF